MLGPVPGDHPPSPQDLLPRLAPRSGSEDDPQRHSQHEATPYPPYVAPGWPEDLLVDRVGKGADPLLGRALVGRHQLLGLSNPAGFVSLIGGGE